MLAGIFPDNGINAAARAGNLGLWPGWPVRPRCLGRLGLPGGRVNAAADGGANLQERGIGLEFANQTEIIGIKGAELLQAGKLQGRAAIAKRRMAGMPDPGIQGHDIAEARIIGAHAEIVFLPVTSREIYLVKKAYAFDEPGADVKAEAVARGHVEGFAPAARLHNAGNVLVGEVGRDGVFVGLWHGKFAGIVGDGRNRADCGVGMGVGLELVEPARADHGVAVEQDDVAGRAEADCAIDAFCVANVLRIAHKLDVWT